MMELCERSLVSHISTAVSSPAKRLGEAGRCRLRVLKGCRNPC